MQKIKVNILKNLKQCKPDKKEMGYLQNIIWKENNTRELPFHMFARYVGEMGCHWKSSLLEGGSKNECFKVAYVLSLDFDDDITIEEFTEKANDLGLTPTFMYKTYSHNTIKESLKEKLRAKTFINKKYQLTKGMSVYKVRHERWRAVWRLNEPIENAQLKTALQLMLMEAFPQCDVNCKDLSRFWVGGKELFYYNEFKTLNLENLKNACTTNISVNSNNGHASRDIKAFAKKVGLRLHNKSLFMLDKSVLCVNDDAKSGEKVYQSYNIYYREGTEISHILYNNEEFEIIEYDNYLFSLDTKSYNIATNNNRKADAKQLKTSKASKLKFDSDRLQQRCLLYNDLLTGTKLGHNEIYHLSSNLHEFRGYGTILEDALNKYNYNNPINKHNTYIIAMENNYKPQDCIKGCKYHSECNVRNIKEKYYYKEAKIVQVYDYKLNTREQSEKELAAVPNKIKDMSIKDILCLLAPTGLGKTEMLKKVLKIIPNVIIGVSNHQLGKETYERLKEVSPNLLYVPKLDTKTMPKDLKSQIDNLYEIGLAGDVKDIVFDEISRLNDAYKSGVEYPDYYYNMIEWVEALSKIKDADTLIMTHSRISYGTNNTKIDTMIIDEDLINSFIDINGFKFDDMEKELAHIKDWINRLIEHEYLGLKEEAELLKSALDEYYDQININMKDANPKVFANPFREPIANGKIRNLITDYIKHYKDKINMNIFKLLKSEYIVYKPNQRIYTASADGLKQLQGYKLVLMSATLDRDVHIPLLQRYLPEKDITWINIANTELEGEIICDCSYSFSRDSLRNPTDKVKKKLEEIMSSDKYTNVITFKENFEALDFDKYGKKQILHFGKVEGIDAYKNQALTIIGTPHTNSVYYEMLGALITGGKSPKSDKWEVKLVEYGGYKFPLNTYSSEEDLLFTKIQLYKLTEQLVQAVGRARALRFDCKVFVYSAIPLSNATVLGAKKSKDCKVIELSNEEYKVLASEYIEVNKDMFRNELIEIGYEKEKNLA